MILTSVLYLLMHHEILFTPVSLLLKVQSCITARKPGCCCGRGLHTE